MLIMVRGLEPSLILSGRLARLRAIRSWSLAALFMLPAGCPHGKQAESEPAKMEAGAPRASVALRVLVVNEPGVAEVINRLRGEWAERSGGEISVVLRDWKEVAGAK